MGLIYRTSSLANGAATSIKNAPLTYQEGDGNIAFLLTNLSGSNTIQGTTTVDGPIQINDTIQIDGLVYMPNLTSAAQASLVTYDSSSGRFYYTASSAAISPTVVSAAGSTLYSITPAAGGPGSFNNTNSIFFGDSSADGAVGADNAIFMGYRSGRFASNARYCIFLGAESGYNAYSAFHSVFIGSYAGSGTEDATYSNFIGYSAGASATSAQFSNFMGREAGAYADSAVYSNFIGYNAGAYATNAQYSSFLGAYAGRSAVSASYSTLLGYGVGDTDFGLTGPGRNNIIIGTSITLEDNRRDSINIGGIIYGTGSYYSTSTVSSASVSNGRIGIGISLPRYTLDVSGSGNYSNGLLVTGSLRVSQTVNSPSFTGSLLGTSSWANNAQTASLAPNYLPLTGGTINGNVTVNGTASIAFLNVTVESASVIYSSGSNQFGDAANDTQTMYGTVVVPNGNIEVTGSVTSTQGFTGSLFGTSSWAISASWSPSNVGGSDTQIQFNGGNEFSGSDAFRFVYDSQSLEHGQNVQAVGQYSFAHGGGLLNFLPTIASGSYSHAEGQNTIAIGISSHAEGISTQAVESGSHSEGGNTVAAGQYSHAEGDATQAIGFGSHAEGYFTQATAQFSHAEGYQTIALGLASHTAGNQTIASGSFQSVIGRFNISSSADSAFIIGNGSDNNNRSNLLFATGSQLEVSGSLRVTGSAFITGLNSTSQTNVLTYNSTTGQIFFTASSAIGGGGGGGGSVDTSSLLTTASVSLNTITFTKGDGTTFPITVNTGSGGGGGSTSPAGSDTFIQFNSASQFAATSSLKFNYDRQALAHGYDINVFSTPGMYSHAQGDSTYALGNYSHAEGGWNNAIAIYSHTEGYGTSTYGSSSHAEGNYTATGTPNAWSGSWRLSHITMSSVHGNVASSFNVGDRLYLYRTSDIVGQVITDRTISSSFYDAGLGSTVLGLNLTIGSTRREVYLGNIAADPIVWTGGGSNIIPAHKAHSEGNNTKAIGQNSHAEGDGSVAYGRSSHAEGAFNKAIGQGSHAEGYATEAISDYSHAEGFFTQAAGGYQTVVGAYNITSSLNGAFIIGNGDFSTRRNLLFAQGTNVEISGSTRITGSIDLVGNQTITGSATITDVLTLPFQDPLPSNRPTGSVAISGSGGTFEGMYVYNGTSWTNVKA